MTNKVYHRKGVIFVADDGEVLQPTPGGVKMSHGHSDSGSVGPKKITPKTKPLLRRADDSEIARKVVSGLRLSAAEETRLIETMAAMDPEAGASEQGEQALINQMAAL